MNYKKIKIKSYLRDFLFLTLVTFIYFTPVIILGADRVEDYKYNHFTLLIKSEYFFNPFLFFFDLIGPGTRLPLGSGLNYFFLPAIFIKEIKLFYFFSFIFGFYLQLNYIKKVLKILNFQNPYILTFFYSLSIGIIFYLVTGDSIKTFFTISCYPGIFYYLIKFLQNKSSSYFFKLILFLLYLTANSHPAYITLSLLPFFLLVILNKKFFFLKEKYFYFGLCLFLIGISEILYWLIYESFYFTDSAREQIIDLNIKHYTSGIVFILKFFEDFLNLDFPYLTQFKSFDNFYLPFGGILFYFSFYEAIRLIIKQQSQSIYYLNIIFLITIFLSLVDLGLISFSIISSTFAIRDINNFFSILLFGNFLKNIKNKQIINTILVIALATTMLHFSSSLIRHYNDLKYSNYNIIKKNSSFENSEIFKNFKLDKNNIKSSSKTYLSKGVWNLINNRDSEIFLNANIFHFSDLLKLNIYPFNSEFKNSSKHQLRDQSDLKMHSVIDPKFDEINNNYFFDLFNINSLIILESELNLIKDINKFKKVSHVQSKYGKIILFELVKKHSIMIDNYQKKIIKNKCKSQVIVDCLINMDGLFKKSEKISFQRIGINKYKITNNSSDMEKFILPFLYDHSWRSDQYKIQDIEKTFMFLEIRPNSESIIYYNDLIRNILSILSIFVFAYLLFKCLKRKT